MKHSLKSKLPETGTSIFTTMSALARKHNAINLSQGFPDFDPDPKLIELAHYYMKTGANQYAPAIGIPSLRAAISQAQKTLFDTYYNPETEITVTSGATEALFCAITAVVNPGDEVIILEPAYDSYKPVVQLNGGVPVFVSLSSPDFTPDWEQIEAVITKKTRLLIINSPHNPTGSIFSDDDYKELSRLVQKHDLFVLSDEVYMHIVFDGKKHRCTGHYPELFQRTFVVGSFGKSFHTTGWKMGFCTAPDLLMQEFRKVHQFVTFSSPTPFQFAIAEFMKDMDWFEGLSGFYQKKRDYFLSQIEPSHFTPLPCNGSYFQLLSYEGISTLPELAFARLLTETLGLASIPLSPFYEDQKDQHLLRFCFAKSEETLHAGAKILNSLPLINSGQSLL